MQSKHGRRMEVRWRFGSLSAAIASDLYRRFVNNTSRWSCSSCLADHILLSWTRVPAECPHGSQRSPPGARLDETGARLDETGARFPQGARHRSIGAAGAHRYGCEEGRRNRVPAVQGMLLDAEKVVTSQCLRWKLTKLIYCRISSYLAMMLPSHHLQTLGCAMLTPGQRSVAPLPTSISRSHPQGFTIVTWRNRC